MRDARVTIFDYGAGNLHSLAKAVALAGVEPVIEADPRRAVDTDVLLLPGVGAFTPAAERLAPGRDVMREALQGGLPCLGICLGMQLLLETSDEGPGAGLGVVAGRVTRLEARRLPQIGWNTVEECTEPLLGAVALRQAYYANSFVCRPSDPSVTTAFSTHGHDRFPAALRVHRTVGVQFHPEKSSEPGVAFLRAFLTEATA